VLCRLDTPQVTAALAAQADSSTAEAAARELIELKQRRTLIRKQYGRGEIDSLAEYNEIKTEIENAIEEARPWPYSSVPPPDLNCFRVEVEPVPVHLSRMRVHDDLLDDQVDDAPLPFEVACRFGLIPGVPDGRAVGKQTCGGA
jgi:hypothetical protein